MEEIDSDNSGKVEFKEFVRVMAKKAESAKIAEKQKEFEDAFRVNIWLNMFHIPPCARQLFDRDGSGQISPAELRYVLTGAGSMRLTEEEVAELVAAVDADQDGLINFRELVKMFTGADSVRELVIEGQTSDTWSIHWILFNTSPCQLVFWESL